MREKEKSKEEEEMHDILQENNNFIVKEKMNEKEEQEYNNIFTSVCQDVDFDPPSNRLNLSQGKCIWNFWGL